MPKDNFFSAKYSPTLWSGKYVSGNHKTQFWIEFFFIESNKLEIFLSHTLYRWSLGFVWMGKRISHNRLNKSHNFSYGYPFLSTNLLLLDFLLNIRSSPPEIFGLFQSLIECIYRHLILDIGPWTNLNIKETPKLRWKQVNICSAPFTINIS